MKEAYGISIANKECKSDINVSGPSALLVSCIIWLWLPLRLPVISPWADPLWYTKVSVLCWGAINLTYTAIHAHYNYSHTSYITRHGIVIATTQGKISFKRHAIGCLQSSQEPKNVRRKLRVIGGIVTYPSRAPTAQTTTLQFAQ